MIEILDKHNCCGCEACVQVCPRHCISFDEDIEGFHYPLVDKTVCIDCGLCERVCPILNQAEERPPLKVYAAKNRNEEELLNSSSGGIFILLAKAVIQNGGVVFGARFDENWNVVHAYAETEKDLKAFMGSKYVQSRIGNTYREAMDFLEAGRQVLFSGTPCQIAALKKKLKKEYNNLLTVDVICHGVPSPKVWRMYLEEIKRNVRKGENSVSSPLTHLISERDAHGESIQIKNISFRDKRLGWKKYSFALTLAKASADGKQNTVSFSQYHRENIYMKGFLDNLYLRPSCHICRFKKFQSRSDISIADFWAVSRALPDFYDQKGVGLVFINTEKGEVVMKKSTFEYRDTTFAAASSNHGLREVVPIHKKRAYFFSKLNSTNSIESLIQECLKPSFFERLIVDVKKIIKLLK